MLTRKQLEQAESLLDQLEKEAEESQRAIEVLLKRRQLAKNRLDADTAKAPVLASTDTKNAIKDKRDLVQGQLDKPLSEDACDKAEQGLSELEDMVVEAGKEVEEKKLGVEIAKEIQTLSGEALNELSKVKAPAGFAKIDRKDLGAMLKNSASYAALKDFESVINALINKKNEPERSEIVDLLADAETLRKAIKDAGEEVLIELKDRAAQVQNQRDLVNTQMSDNNDMMMKFQQPSKLVETLLKSWPKEATRPKDLNQRLLKLVDTSNLDQKRNAAEDMADQELKTAPWTDANWLGNVMPLAQDYATDLREALKGLNVAAQKEVVEALGEAMIETRKVEAERKNAVIQAIKGGNDRDSLAASLKDPGKSIFEEVDKAKKKNKLNLVKQEELANALFLKRETNLKEQQEKLAQEAQNAGVQTAPPDPTMYGNKKYALLGSHAKATVYARLDDCPTGSGMGAFINLYKTALSKGIIPSSSTGSEGVKYEDHLGGWVVKVTRRAVAHNTGFDNVWSPFAANNTASVGKVDEPPAIYLDFNAWTDRH